MLTFQNLVAIMRQNPNLHEKLIFTAYDKIGGEGPRTAVYAVYKGKEEVLCATGCAVYDVKKSSSRSYMRWLQDVMRRSSRNRVCRL